MGPSPTCLSMPCDDETPKPRELSLALALSSPDLLLQVFGFLDAPSLTSARATQRLWTEPADGSPAWPLLCWELWREKQNVPREQWVRTFSEASPEDTARHQIEFLLLILQMSSASMPEVEHMLTVLKFLRVSTKRRQAAPVSVVLREEQIGLENELAGCEDEVRRERLLETIVANMRSPVAVDEAVLDRFRSEGRLLSWRESFIASMFDSSRCCIHYKVFLNWFQVFLI